MKQYHFDKSIYIKMRISLVFFLFFFLADTIYAQSPREELNFDRNWRFARFGQQADGSRLPEPGNLYTFTFRASGEQQETANEPLFAMDNNPATGWQPVNMEKHPWIEIDLQTSTSIRDCQVDKEGPCNSITIEGSYDRSFWSKLPGVFRYIKITIDREISEEEKDKRKKREPFLLKEIKLFDNQGNSIKNEPVCSVSPKETAFDGSQWRVLDVPHDWGIEGPFRIDLEGYTGKLPWRGIGWYRKDFTVSPQDKGKQFYLDFDGAMANAEIWLNGKKVGERPYGYISFRVDLTPYILFDQNNVVAVRLNTEKLGARWYPGAGIYRHVRLVKTNPLHVSQWGVFVTTPEITDNYGTASVQVDISNHLKQTVNAGYSVEIWELKADDSPGIKVAGSKKKDIRIDAGSSVTDITELKINKPKRWSLEQTNRYMARVSVYKDKKLTDVYDTPFGFRTIEFTHDNGFLLNGKRVQLNGTCNHHDLGALGAAINTAALKRQLTILKSFGCNAIRTAHNPPAPELLMLADKMGFLVIDEAFDCWEYGKNENDYSVHYKEWHKKDLEALICRDRNHPSVIMWSTGNEVVEQYYPEKGTAKYLTEIIHDCDPTRPATFGASYPSKSAMNGTELQVDVHGMNYAAGVYGGPDFYGEFLNLEGHEHLSGYASETSSTFSSRGEYFPRKFQVSSYDLQEPGWGALPDQEFAALDKYPGICGEFVWTGFDYLGEPTPFNSDFSVLLNHAGSMNSEQMEKEREVLIKIAEERPTSRSSYFGIVDLAGFPKDRYYLYQSRWLPDLPMVHILPHWNFPEKTGENVPVFIYTSGDEAELFLNGKSLGKKKKQAYEYRLRWEDVVYEPGELKAVAYKDGTKWAETIVKTTGEATKLKLTPNKMSIIPDGEDLVFVTISITDREGNTVPTAENTISCRLEGDGEIVATDNGDATCLITFSEPVRPAFNGLLLAIVKTKPDAKRPLKLIVESDGLEKDVIEIDFE